MKDDDNDNLRNDACKVYARVCEESKEIRLDTHTTVKQNVTQGVLVAQLADAECDCDVVEVFSGFLSHMSPPFLSHPSCHSLLSPNKHEQNAQQTWKDAPKTGKTFALDWLKELNKHPPKDEGLFSLSLRLFIAEEINTSSPEKTIKARVVYDTL